MDRSVSFKWLFGMAKLPVLVASCEFGEDSLLGWRDSMSGERDRSPLRQVLGMDRSVSCGWLFGMAKLPVLAAICEICRGFAACFAGFYEW